MGSDYGPWWCLSGEGQLVPGSRRTSTQKTFKLYLPPDCEKMW